MKYGQQAIAEAALERWENHVTGQDYTINMQFPEFTCLCPRSGYPDFAVIKIEYIPDKYVVELKSLKLYLNSFRNRYISHEDSTNEIYEALNNLLKPKFIELTGDFAPRGNLRTVVKVSSGKR